MDHQHHEPPDADNAAVAEARAALASARKSERVGSVAVAYVRLASTFANSDLHTEAVAEYNHLLSYLQMATSGRQQTTSLWAGAAASASQSSQPDAVDLNRLEALARLNQVESFLELGQLDEARAGLVQVAPMCRGFRRKTFRKKLAQLQKRLDRTTQGKVPEATSRPSPRDSQSPTTAGPESKSGSSMTLTERLAAADATLGRGDAGGAAREALGIISECGEDDHCRAQARQVLGMALDAMGKPEDSLAAMKLSLADYLAADDFAQAANLAIPMAIRLDAIDERPEAISLVRRCLNDSKGSIPDSVQARLKTNLGRLLDDDEDPTEARRSFESACQIAPDVRTRADAEHGLAVSLGDDNTADAEQSVEALVLIDAAKSGYSELGSLFRVAGCEHEAAALLGRLGSLPAAESRYQKALSAYEALDTEQNDADVVAREAADCQRNIVAIQSQETSDPSLFRSGGHDMDHS